MKIPENTANIGAYYGNEENGEWQPNGVIIDTGVGGGVVGSGDAGIPRPPVYPVHLPRGHIPGYVMAGAYYPTAPYAPVPPPQDDFADYMWMENEEEFDKQVMQQLEEEALMEQCIEAMLEDEQRERHRPVANGHNHNYPTTSNGNTSLSLEETVSRSTLNPLAAEFVPTFTRPPAPQTTEVKQETTEPSSPESPLTEESSSDQTDSKEDSPVEKKTEVTEQTPPTDPPEVSAAHIQTDKRKDKKDTKKVETKKPIKQEVKKTKPVAVKSEPKVQPKKKEVKTVKSEPKIEEQVSKVEEQVSKVEEIVTKVVQPQQCPVPTPPEDQPSMPGIKPINYAAAAKANKPKKPSTSPPVEKTAPAPVKTDRKPEKLEKPEARKPLARTEKPSAQRKNSAK